MKHAFTKACRTLAAALSLFLLVLALAPEASGQETTAGIQGTIKDPSGATIAGAVVTVSGNQLIGEKTANTDKTGYYRFTNLPPGSYSLKVSASGFSETRRDGIDLQVGRLPSIDINLSVGSDKTVIEVSTATPLIDITQSNTLTNVTRDELDYDPRGRSFQSVIQFAPGARSEPLQNNGYSIDGATSSENGYLIDGMSTNALDSGQSKANLPFEFIQEVEVKTSGFSAEFGGALGGVVTATEKRGSNNFHGEILTYYEADPLDASPATTVRFNPQISANSSNRIDIPYQNYTPVKDHYRQVQPGAIVTGYLVKDRLWMTAAIEPYFTSIRRVTNFNFTNGAVSSVGPVISTQDTQQYFGLARLDGKVTDKIRVFGAFLYQYYRISGGTLPNPESINGLFNSSSTSNPFNFNHGIGNVQPNSVSTAGADITITPALVATTRYGYFYNNLHTVGTPAGIRYSFSSSGIGLTGLDGTAAGAAAQQATGYANISDNTATTATQNINHQFNQDVAYFKKGFFGQHNFKVGYQLNHQIYNIRQIYNSALVQVVWGQAYPVLPANQPNCAAVEATNVTLYGKSGSAPTGSPATTIDTTKCQGNFGYVIVRDFTNGNGQVSENNHGLYFQDAWTVGHGLTLNLGVRLEKEKVPAFNLYPSGIDFGLGGKVAPRLGGAWDVFQNGKLKLFGSYGVFNDVFKLNLAIGSFGGNYWHGCYYALDDVNYTRVQPIRDANGHYCSGSGGANLATVTPAPAIRFLENQDFRIAANDPANPIQPGVDPNIKSFRQHEAVFGADYQITRMWSFESRWTRRRVDHAIEDTGIQTANGEAFPISNPGEGIDAQPVPNCPTCPNQPKAARAYDGIEFRFTKVASAHWFGQFDYTYSRLRGNYSGLVDSDVADGNATTAAGIRSTSPNNGRAFDEPFFQFDAHGKPFNGLLATDRPHTFKAITYYRISYLKRHESTVGLFQQVYSGTPLSTYLDVAGGGSYEVYPEGRGKWVPVTADANGVMTYGTPVLRRTPVFFQSDLSFTHAYKISQAHEAWRLGFEANLTNVLNSKRPVIFGTKLNSPNKSGQFIKPVGYNTGGALNYSLLMHGYDYQTLSNTAASQLTLNSEYGVPTAFQTPRQIRLKVKFTF
jgi:hypothetical protein